MPTLKIAILGTRGIPNHYGGYEQAATFLSRGLAKRGHSVTVYNSHNHPYKEGNWNGVEIIHCYDPEYKIGTAGQFIYDLNCLRHARKRGFDIVLLLGYTSSSIWHRFYPRNSVIISNMDGLEWKRTKYSALTRRFLRYAEKQAVKYSDNHIADSTAIQSYLRKKYKIDSRFISYGASIYPTSDKDVLREYGVTEQGYYLLIARIEPENNIQTILDGFLAGDSGKEFVVVGNLGHKFGKEIYKKYNPTRRIKFIGPLFDQQKLHSLKAHCNLYFHGHSVGGTNPSLLEAMASGAPIVAHDNPFNQSVLGSDAYYFASAEDVANLSSITSDQTGIHNQMINNNLEKIKRYYNWETIIEQYEKFMLQCYLEWKK